MREWLMEKEVGVNYWRTTLNFLQVQIIFLGFFYMMFMILDEPITIDGNTVDIILSSSVFQILFIAAAIEELMFRVIILIPAVLLRISTANILILSLVSSLVYASFYPDLPNQMMQGVSSMFLCIQFMKMGIFQGRYIQAIASSFMVNFSVKIIKFVLVMQIMKS